MGKHVLTQPFQGQIVAGELLFTLCADRYIIHHLHKSNFGSQLLQAFRSNKRSTPFCQLTFVSISLTCSRYVILGAEMPSDEMVEIAIFDLYACVKRAGQTLAHVVFVIESLQIRSIFHGVQGVVLL